MTKLALAQPDGLTIRDEQFALLRDTIAKGATPGEFDMFVQTCNRLRLDPFARQIFLVKRWDGQLQRMSAASQVSIDGLRLVAERTHQYRGQTAPEWCGQDGKWVDVWLDETRPPAAARCGVYRDGFAEPLVRVARYTSYVQMTTDKKTNTDRPNRMWATMPDVMLSKCAESLALRAAFPNELSGIYTAEEMGQAESDKRPASTGRTLDDVAGEAVVTPTSPLADTPMTEKQARAAAEELLVDLPQCVTKATLVSWARELLALKLSAADKAAAWAAWADQCAVRELVPADLAKEARAK